MFSTKNNCFFWRNWGVTPSPPLRKTFGGNGGYQMRQICSKIPPSKRKHKKHSSRGQKRVCYITWEKYLISTLHKGRTNFFGKFASSESGWKSGPVLWKCWPHFIPAFLGAGSDQVHRGSRGRRGRKWSRIILQGPRPLGGVVRGTVRDAWSKYCLDSSDSEWSGMSAPDTKIVAHPKLAVATNLPLSAKSHSW